VRGSEYIVRLLDWFEEPSVGICMVFERGMSSLWDYIQMRQGETCFCLADIREFGRQILTAVQDFHTLGITHADFKPENLVLFPKERYEVRHLDHSRRRGHSAVAPSQSFDQEPSFHESDDKVLKVIDFGLAVFEHSYHTPVVGTRAYSPPETVLETGWSHSLDIWGVACILMEMYTGRTIFRCTEDFEQIALWERSLGPLPSHILAKASRGKRGWFSNGRLRRPPQGRFYHQQPRLRDMFHPDDYVFCDLITNMLQYDPRDRLRAEEALRHPFFTTSPVCTCN